MAEQVEASESVARMATPSVLPEGRPSRPGSRPNVLPERHPSRPGSRSNMLPEPVYRTRCSSIAPSQSSFLAPEMWV